MDDKIIPFGKYEGKPIEILATDPGYVQWLLAQPWFKQKFLSMYTVVINNFREPDETPEHNRAQVKFLKAEYRLKLAYLINPNLFQNNSAMLNAEMKKYIRDREGLAARQSELFLHALANPNAEEEYGLYTRNLLIASRPQLEPVDVRFSFWYGLEFTYDSAHYNHGRLTFRNRRHSIYSVEVKPTIGDDFPRVLRQMKASMPVEESTWQSDRFYALVVGKYSGEGASQEEFVAYFQSQGYWVVFEHQIDEVILPAFEREFVLDSEIEQLTKALPQHSKL